MIKKIFVLLVLLLIVGCNKADITEIKLEHCEETKADLVIKYSNCLYELNNNVTAPAVCEVTSYAD